MDNCSITTAWYVALVCAGLLWVTAGSQAADFSGTFTNEDLSVSLSRTPDGYKGQIQSGGQRFAATAREVDGRLQGTFVSEGNSFEFNATLQDDILTFSTGDATYALRKVKAPPVNPLSRKSGPASPSAAPPAVSAAGRASTPASPVKSAGNILRFRKVSVNDQAGMIGGEAFSFLAPVDWQVDGGVVWRLHPTMPAAVAMRVHPPQGVEQLEAFPTVAFSWGGYLGPGTFFPPGANYLGNEVQPPLRDAVAYLKERHIPRARDGLRVQIVKTEELPKLAEAARQAEPAAPFGGPQMVFTAGRVRVEYEWEGKPVEEDLYGVLNTMALPAGNMTIQIADKLFGLRAPKGRLDETTRLFETMIHSMRINLQWFNRYAQLVQALTQAQMNQIRAAGDLSRYISRTSSEISDMMRQSYEQRQASQDRINQNWSQYMRGVDEYYNPAEQRAVELPSGYRNAWVNGQGEYIVTDNTSFNPNVELDGNWQPLQKKEP
jgi:hypothetical protein